MRDKSYNLLSFQFDICIIFRITNMLRNKNYFPAYLIPAIIFIIASLPFNAYAQNYRFKHLGLRDGLSQVTVNRIFQDSQGFMWFGTQDGLNLYDGYTFKHFRSDPNNNNSLSHNWIWDIFEDSQHNIWVATWSGLNKISPDKSVITRYYPEPDRPGSMRGERPVSIQEAKNGTIWIATWSGGLNLYYPEKDSFLCFSSALQEGTNLPGDYIRNIHLDAHQNLWVGSWAGLWKVDHADSGQFKFSYIDILPGKDKKEIKITDISHSPGGSIWVSTLGLGVFELSDEGEIIENFQREYDMDNGLKSNQVSCIASDASGKIWIGTVSRGICLYDPASRHFIHINHNPENTESIAADDINSLCIDKSGLIWCGTNGLSIFNPSQNKFNSNSDLVPIGSNLNNMNNISVLFQDYSNRIWLGTSGNGIYCLQYSNKHSKNEWLENTLKSLNKLNVSSIVSDEEDNIWIGTRANGLLKLSIENQKLSNIVEYPDNLETHGLNFINGLAFIPPDKLYIATYEKGLISYNTRFKTYERFRTQEGDPSSFPANYLLRVYKDKTNKLWICSWGAGIIHFNPENNSWKSYSNIPDDPNSLGDNIPQAFCETYNNNKRKIWIGTRKGLSLLDLSIKDNNTFKNYYPSDGLPGDIINSILEDDKAQLWLSSNSGISRFSPDSMNFLNFEEHDGLQGNEFNAGAGIHLNDGRLMFGGVNGFNVFYPDSIKPANFSPDIVITSFKVFDKEIIFNPQNPKTKLSHKENFLSFNFASLDYTQPLQNQYKYQMTGVDKDWVFSDNRRYASYTNIDPGNYIFKVMGTNSDGLWSNKMAEFAIEITPPYWQTWWFRISIALVVIGLVYLFMAYRINKIKDIEKLRIRIASDLHDDIGSSLTRITIHSQQIQNGRDKTKVATSIEKIGELSRDIISTMSDIVWSIDTRNDNLTDMRDRIHDFAYNTLSERDITVTFREDGMEKNKKIDVLFRQNIFSIFKESVNNIVKHAEAEKVEIEMINSEKEFNLKIIDNGKGFDEEKIKKGNGLQNMKMRAGRIGAVLEITNEKGTVISLKCKKL